MRLPRSCWGPAGRRRDRRQRLRRGPDHDPGSSLWTIAVIPLKLNRKLKGSCDRQRYTQRNRVERCLNKLKHFRGLATLYCKKIEAFSAHLPLSPAPEALCGCNLVRGWIYIIRIRPWIWVWRRDIPGPGVQGGLLRHTRSQPLRFVIVDRLNR